MCVARAKPETTCEFLSLILGFFWFIRARPEPKTPSINDETNPTVHKIIPATCNVNSWEVEMVLERPTLLNAQELFQLPVHITLVAGIL